jgi:uncharacterized protein (UPF0332 family)
MYSAARALMNHMGFRSSSRDSHLSVIKFLALVEVGEEVNEFSIILDRLRRSRHRVMYDDYDFISENVALDAKSWSVKFLSIIEQKIKDLNLTVIQSLSNP